MTQLSLSYISEVGKNVQIKFHFIEESRSLTFEMTDDEIKNWNDTPEFALGCLKRYLKEKNKI